MLGCGVVRNTASELAVVEDIWATAANEEPALAGLSLSTRWQPLHHWQAMRAPSVTFCAQATLEAQKIASNAIPGLKSFGVNRLGICRSPCSAPHPEYQDRPAK